MDRYSRNPRAVQRRPFGLVRFVALAALALATGCFPKPLWEPGRGSGRVLPSQVVDVEMDNWRVAAAAPPETGWEVSVCYPPVGFGSIEFTRKRSWLGAVQTVDMIEILRNWVTPEGRERGEEELAKGFIDQELAIMKERGVEGGNYILSDVERGETTIGGKKLYWMSHSKTLRTIRYGMKAQKCLLHVYFPPDFAKDHVFFVILTASLYNRGSVWGPMDLSISEPVIESLEVARVSSEADDAEAARLLAEAKSKPGLEKTMTLDCGDGVTMELVLIPVGQFMMGEGNDSHRVTITRPFYLGKLEVTQAQYEAVMSVARSHWKEATRPVEKVSWHEAMEFCDGVSERVGKQVRLPTEAEWEYACRAGTTTRFCFGDDVSGVGDFAWYKGNSAGETHAAGGKRANAWGLHDMHGNVNEWCADWHGNFWGAAIDPTGPANGILRVLRGGSFESPTLSCGSASRAGSDPRFGLKSFGFRVAVDVGDVPDSAFHSRQRPPSSPPRSQRRRAARRRSR